MATTRPFTVEELEQSPPEGEWELIDGELVPVNPTSFRSSMTGLRIGSIIRAFAIDHDLGIVTGADGGFVLFPDRETLLAPDVGFISKDRVPPEDEQDRFPRLAPDLVVEVLSPSDRMAAALGKISIYMEAGVQAVWLVDPGKRTITVFVDDDAPLRLGDDDTLTGGEVLPGFSIRVSDLLG
jgi:Uma2 family endonuclease